MPRIELPIIGGFYQNRSLPISSQECTNWYVNPNQGDGLASASLFGTPGTESIATSGNTVKDINRGAHVKGGIPYFVNGEKLYSLLEDGTLTELGDVPGSGRVSMADNGTQLMILIPGGNGYIYNEDDGTPFQQITDADFTANGQPQYVVFIDGYFAVTTDSKKFIVSALNDGLSWNALDFGSAEADPDDIVAPVVLNNQLFIAGSETIEVFQNIGGASFPFQRVQGFIIPKGCFAPFTLIQASGLLFWIGGGVNESPQIYALQGNSPTIISTDGIDALLDQATPDQIANAFAWSYSQAGARFIGFTVGDTTAVYDLTSQKWHERKSQVQTDFGQELKRYRVNSLVTAYNRVYVGDNQDGRIGRLDLDLYTEYGEEVIRTVSTIPFANTGNRLFVPMLELTMESGVGDFVTRDPVVWMETSEDGKTWSDPIRRPMGRVGEYERRTIWRRVGWADRFKLFRFTMSDPVKPVIIKLEADIVT